MENNYSGSERRDSERLEFSTPLGYKICKRETVDKLLKGYSVDISCSGLLCSIKEKVNKDDLLWLSFSRDTLDFCKELEKRVFIYQNGIIGNVTRVDLDAQGAYNVGIKFIVREEKELGNIYSEVHFLKRDFENKNE